MEEVHFPFILHDAETIVMTLVILLLMHIEIRLIDKGYKYLRRKILRLSFKETVIQSFSTARNRQTLVTTKRNK